jgi:hypothetical protein
MTSINEAPSISATKPGNVKWITSRGVTAFIVPLIGLAAALISGNLMLLDYVHVMTGATWTGIDLFMGFAMSYVLRSSSTTVRAEVARKLTPFTMLFIPSISSVAITAGYLLAGREGLFSFHSPLIIAAGLIVVILLVQGLGIFLPNSVRVLLELGKQTPDFGKISRLMMLNFKLSGVQGILQIALIFVMANLAFA